MRKILDIMEFCIYLKGTTNRGPNDDLLYVTTKTMIEKQNNIIGIRKVLSQNGKEIGRVLYNGPLMIRDIEDMTKSHKDGLVKLPEKVLKPSVYNDAQRVLKNLRAILNMEVML